MEGIIPSIENAPVVEYDPRKGITVEDICELMRKFRTEDNRRRRIKPEFVLSEEEAEGLPLSYLDWLGENYNVLCSFKASQIVKERERIFWTNHLL